MNTKERFEELVDDATLGVFKYVEDEHFNPRTITDQILIFNNLTNRYSISTIRNLRNGYKYKMKGDKKI